MSRVCFIHIGLHKTGSTAVQQLLLHNQERLRELGCYRPVTGTETNRHSHYDLAGEIRALGPARASPVIEKLVRELREAGDPQMVVISAEGLSLDIAERTMRDRIAQFAARIGYHPHLVVYVRPQPQAINSAFTQQVKMWRASETFAAFFESRLAHPSFDYRARLGPLLADERFTTSIRPYSSAVLSNGLCADFLATLGIPSISAATFLLPRAYNVSPGPKTIAAMQHLTRRLAEEDMFIPPAMARPIIAIADSRGWNASKFDGINRHRLKMAHAHFADSNEEFAQAAWSRSWFDVFPEEKDREAAPNIFRPNRASTEENAEFMEFVDEALLALRELARKGEPIAGPDEMS